MYGGFHFSVAAKDYNISFDIVRKVTLIVGDSGSGKSDLCRQIADSQRAGDNSINCKYKCTVFDQGMADVVCNAMATAFQKFPKRDGSKKAEFEEYINSTFEILGVGNCVYFIDEGISSLNTVEMGAFMKYAEAFFVVVSRNTLRYVPYSIASIYTMVASGKFHKLVRTYKDFLKLERSYDLVITEDAGAGNEFYRQFYKNSCCIAAGLNTKMAACYKEHYINGSYILLVADGAAIGSQIRLLLDVINDQVTIFLPDSFEFLLLDGLFDEKVHEVVRNTVKYADTSFFTWEDFYTQYLKEITKDLGNEYSKSVLDKCYYLPCCFESSKVKKYKCNIGIDHAKMDKVLGKYITSSKTGRVSAF